MIVVLVAVNVVGVQEAAALNVVLAVVDFATQLLLVAARVLPRLQPGDPRRQRALGRRADLGEPRARDAGRDARLHGRRDGLEPRRGGARPDAKSVPDAYKLVGGRRLRDLLHAPADRALGDAGRARDRRRVRRRSLGASARGGRLRERPGARPRARTSGSRDACSTCSRSTSACSRRRSCFIATNAGVIGASRITYAMASYRQLPEVFRRLHSAVQDAVARARRLRGDRADHRHPAGRARRSSGRSTRSARRCRSRSRTPRSSCCASTEPRAELAFRARPNLCVARRSTGRSSRSSAGSRPGSRGS